MTEDDRTPAPDGSGRLHEEGRPADDESVGANDDSPAADAVPAGDDGGPADDVSSADDAGATGADADAGADAGADAAADADADADPDADDDAQAAVADTISTSGGAWLGVAAASFAAVALGVLLRSPGPILLGGLGTVLVAYERLTAPPAADVAIERSFDPANPGVGEPVTVTVTVKNTGSHTLPDVRLSDGVPPSLRVTDGAASTGTTLRAGGQTSFEYDVTGGSGRHRFERARVVVRDVAGVVERRAQVAADTDTVTWETPPGDRLLPVDPRNPRRPGRLETSDPGQGLSFHSLREYRHGDSLSRVDWRRTARTGELTTVEFQRERAATIVALVDTRPEAGLAPGENAPTAIERSATAVAALVERLPEAGHAVGIAATSASDCWLSPGHGPTQTKRARDLLGDHPAFRPQGSERGWDDAVSTVLERLPGDAHVIYLSPLCDETAAAIARRIDARGHGVTVVSPDPTATDTAGHRLARLERNERLSQLRAAGVATHDWPADASFEHVVARARWSR